MKRIHYFEFLDLSWYPQTFRCIQTDYLQFSQYIATIITGVDDLIPLFRKAMKHAKTIEILDLCSGGTGSWIRLRKQFELAGMEINVKLTDKYPNPESLQKWKKSKRKGIEYLDEPIDAMNVPFRLNGMRTLFAGFHHFKPEQAQQILRDAFEKKVPIGIFDPSSLRTPFGMILLLLLIPFTPIIVLLSYLIMTPFIKPHTFSRFFWTYLLPIVPITTSWDGLISFLRSYTPQELKELTNSLQSNEYAWEIGIVTLGIPLTYLLGYPIND